MGRPVRCQAQRLDVWEGGADHYGHREPRLRAESLEALHGEAGRIAASHGDQQIPGEGADAFWLPVLIRILRGERRVLRTLVELDTAGGQRGGFRITYQEVDHSVSGEAPGACVVEGGDAQSSGAQGSGEIRM